MIWPLSIFWFRIQMGDEHVGEEECGEEEVDSLPVGREEPAVLPGFAVILLSAVDLLFKVSLVAIPLPTRLFPNANQLYILPEVYTFEDKHHPSLSNSWP
jgi:hypothetical protein